MVVRATDVLTRLMGTPSLPGINAERNWPLAFSFANAKRSFRFKRNRLGPKRLFAYRYCGGAGPGGPTSRTNVHFPLMFRLETR